MLRSAIGHAEGVDTGIVVKKALERLSEDLDGGAPRALIVYASSEFDLSLIQKAVTEAYPDTPLAGGTTLGEFSSCLDISDDSIVITALVSDTIRFSSGIVHEMAGDPSSSIQAAWKQAIADLGEAPKLCLVFPEAHKMPVGRIVRQFADLANGEAGCVLAGGVVGNDPGSDRPSVLFHESSVLGGGVVFMLAGGPVTTHAAVCHNWCEIGRQGLVTEAKGRVIHTIDHRPAVEYYRKSLGPQAPVLPEFPFSIREGKSGFPKTRGVLAINEDTGAITVSDDVKTGAAIRLAKARPQDLLEGVDNQFRDIPHDVLERSVVAFSFSCGARRWLLGSATHKEVATIKRALPRHLHLAGFYSYGEVGPVAQGGPADLDSYTLITVFLREENATPEHRDDARYNVRGMVPKPALEGTQQEKDFLSRKLARAGYNLENMEQHRDAWFSLMFSLQDGLRKSEEKYRRVVETCAEGFLLLGKDHRIEYVNDSWLRLTGYSREEVLGSSPSLYTTEDVIGPPPDRPKEFPGYWRAETSLIHKHGKRVPVLMNANALTSDSGSLMGYVLFIIDLTEQKKALQLAGQFQQSLLPSTAPDLPGLDIAGRSVPCEEVGGDYFDYINYTDGSCALIIADVSGHGVEASLLMSSVRTYLRSHPATRDNLGDLFSNMNHQLTQDVVQSGRFVTLFLFLADPGSGDLAWVRAGHEPAWVYDPDKDSFLILKGGDLPLGVTEDTRYTVDILKDRPKNALVVLATDGIWESRNSQDEMFGKERFLNIVRDNAAKDARTIRDRVFGAVGEFTRGVIIADDMTLVVAKFHDQE